MARADQGSYTLLSNGAATGAAVQIFGGMYIFTAEGTPAGATVALQMQTANGTWLNVNAVGASSPISATVLPFMATQIYLPPCFVRVALTGGSPSAVFAYICGVG
jgi:hypothetical protein